MTANGRKRIIITGAFRFPDGDAAAARVLGIGKSLRDAGFIVEFAGWETAEREQDRAPDGDCFFQGFRYVSSAEFRDQPLPAWRRLAHYWGTGRRTLSWLRGEDLSGVHAIIAYHGTSRFLLGLRRLCRRHDIALLFDCTEWYESAHMVGGRFGPVALDHALRMRLINRMIGQGIVISRFLESYYAARQCRVFRLPPTIDLEDAKWQLVTMPSKLPAKLDLVYAGTPAKKDLLGTALHGIRHLLKRGRDIRLHLIGPSRSAVAANVDGGDALLEALGDRVVFHGRKPQADIPALLADKDFSLLMRPQKRYAEAGFSTKFVESLAAGTPVLTNLTSDLADYVQDRRESMLMREPTLDAFIETVDAIFGLTPDDIARMRVDARASAREHFDYSAYTTGLNMFIRTLRG